MDYIIKFDNREKELIKILEQRGYSMILENLDIGDIQFLDLITKNIIIIIERKTLPDLSSSIKDGRYKEQKERLIHSIKKDVRKIVLIEGTNYDDFSLPLKTLNSVIINTMIRDNIHIHISKSKEDTIEFIENIILNMSKYYEDLKKEIINGESKSFNTEFSCKTSKKENLTIDICFRNMLSQIPGVSTTMASVYVNKYKNMENFILNIKEETNNDKIKIIKLLSDEKYGANNRRIGDKVGEKIYNFIFNVEIENSNNVNNSDNLNNLNKNIKKKKINDKKNISMFNE
jgi:crossover junction endonuclease MUS81